MKMDGKRNRMDRWRGIKCGPDYIRKQKIFQGCMLLVFIAAGVGLFLTGFLITKTRANIFTVLAILMVLPAAKRVIALVVMLPRRSVERERYDRMKNTVLPDEVLLTDYVFTSADKVMSLDFVIIGRQTVTGVCPGGHGVDSAAGKREREYMADYLAKAVQRTAPEYRVQLAETDEQFYERYAKASRKENPGTDEERDEVVKCLKILAV